VAVVVGTDCHNHSLNQPQHRNLTKNEYEVQVYHGSKYYIYSFCQGTEKTCRVYCGSVGHCIQQWSELHFNAV